MDAEFVWRNRVLSTRQGVTLIRPNRVKVLALLICGFGLCLSAEQKQVFEGWEVHYVVVNSMFLTPQNAEKYGVVRAKDRAVVTISVLDPEGKSVKTKLEGTYTTQLSQVRELEFDEIDESAVYYIATVRFTEQEILRFKVEVELPQGKRTVQFSQKLYLNR